MYIYTYVYMFLSIYLSIRFDDGSGQYAILPALDQCRLVVGSVNAVSRSVHAANSRRYRFQVRALPWIGLVVSTPFLETAVVGCKMP